MAEHQRKNPLPQIHVSGARFVIVEARFYDDIGDMLLAGARHALESAGAAFDVVSVPGALEIPIAVRMAIASGHYAGAVGLGCIIRGETYHFEVVSNESARGLMDMGMTHQFPIGNGILTVEDMAQAVVRADPAQGDKGGDAARAAIMLYSLSRCFGAS
jgi:6,7-dimethyl-8-ribityllumazine synthase